VNLWHLWDCRLAAEQCIIWPEMESNTLYYGDNLPVLRDREHFPDACIDLIYLDPPFNSNRSYNVLFKETAGAGSPAQIEAFEDTWHWSPSAQAAFEEVALHGSDDTARLLKATVDALGHNDVTAYLCMMAVRLIELRRVLKPTGTIWLHCDPTASHYLKVLMDSIFGPNRFLNEVVWKRTSAHSDTKQGMRRCGKIHDLLLVYRRAEVNTWNPVYTPYAGMYLDSEYRHVAQDGRRYKETDLTAAKPGGDTNYVWRVKRPAQRGVRWEADLGDEYLAPQPGTIYDGVTPYKGRYWAYSKENLIDFARRGELIHRETGMPRLMQFADAMPGTALQDLWDDIVPVAGHEVLGYKTQKPLALLERIIGVASNPDDVVLDPFCGCGTAVHAAQKLGRRWLGIDITFLAIGLVERRLRDAFPGISIHEVGVPADLPGAEALAAHDPYQFQFWAIDRLGAQPVSGQHKRGADRGIDGVIPFVEGATNLQRVIVSVKAGHIEPAYVQQLKGVMEGQGVPMGVLVTLREPTRAMRTEAVSAGSYHSDFWNRDYPRIQLITASELLAGKRVEMPPQVSPFSQAAREAERGEQTSLI